MIKLSDRLNNFIVEHSPYTKEIINEDVKKYWYKWSAIDIVRALRSEELSKEMIWSIMENNHPNQVSEQTVNETFDWLSKQSLKWGKLV